MTDEELKPWLEKYVVINGKHSGILIVDPEPKDDYKYKLLGDTETLYCKASGIKKIESDKARVTGRARIYTGVSCAPEMIEEIEINTVTFLHIYFAKERDILINLAYAVNIQYDGRDTIIQLVNGETITIRDTHWESFV